MQTSINSNSSTKKNKPIKKIKPVCLTVAEPYQIKYMCKNIKKQHITNQSIHPPPLDAVPPDSFSTPISTDNTNHHQISYILILFALLTSNLSHIRNQHMQHVDSSQYFTNFSFDIISIFIVIILLGIITFQHLGQKCDLLFRVLCLILAILI
uniref:CSON011228 protein n=1 Tax=Culicoides sonorensis TaxID=179676 RepID=A0A336M5P7_CULSO